VIGANVELRTATSPVRFCFPVHFLARLVESAQRHAVDGRTKESDAGRDDRSKSMKTTRERAEERRLAKLELVREQVENGSLVIRTMTEEERRLYPPRPVKPRRGT